MERLGDFIKELDRRKAEKQKAEQKARQEHIDATTIWSHLPPVTTEDIIHGQGRWRRADLLAADIARAEAKARAEAEDLVPTPEADF